MAVSSGYEMMLRFSSFVLFLACVLSGAAQEWPSVGPQGGPVRSLAADPGNPERIYLGTSSGRLFVSDDGGRTWPSSTRLGSSRLALDHIVAGPPESRTVFVAGWDVDSLNSNGALFRSRDSGRTWDDLSGIRGHSIRALAMAPSNPAVLVAGTLDGVFRTRDGGDTWERISPENHREIRDVESVAIDPANPDVIYAGTWHLPWKTDDGGKSWHSISKGVIDDSDVFSILIDSHHPSTVYISACSGIYRSDDGGQVFRKIQGIPYSARRTRALQMDPSDHRIVYAGTTEGLWKTLDSGATWKRITEPSVVVNDIVVIPDRVLLGTEPGGILASTDGGLTFSASNHGFTHRQVAALLQDRGRPEVLYAGLLNDRESGGVFVSRDGGNAWSQLSEGLSGRDVFILRQTEDKVLVAGTNDGVFLLKPGESIWQPSGRLLPSEPSATTRPKQQKTRQSPLPDAHVTSLVLLPEKWFAGTSSGLFVSSDHGAAWEKVTLGNIAPVNSLCFGDGMLAAAGPRALAVSVNAGESWLSFQHPKNAGTVNSVSIDASGVLWLGAHEGGFRSTDAGETWAPVASLPLAEVLQIQPDPAGDRLLAVGALSTNIFESRDRGRTWRPLDSGRLMRSVLPLDGSLIVLTRFDGVALQPRSIAGAQPQAGASSPVPQF